MTLFLSPTLLHTQAEAHCSLLKRDVTHISCKVAINMERKLNEGFRANCLPNILEHELQRNPFYGFFYLLNGLSIGVLLGSTQVRFRATLFIVILHSKQKKLPRSFIEAVQSKTYSVFVCSGKVNDFNVFQILASMTGAL